MIVASRFEYAAGLIEAWRDRWGHAVDDDGEVLTQILRIMHTADRRDVYRDTLAQEILDYLEHVFGPEPVDFDKPQTETTNSEQPDSGPAIE